jgi:hypothetical protein
VFAGLGASPNTVISAVLGIEIARTLPAFPQTHQIAVWVVDVSLRQETGDVFVKVVQGFDPAGRLVEVAALANQLRANPALWRVDRGADTFLTDQSPFVDRADLQKLLRTMAGGGGPACISVEGKTGEGKTTLCEYIEKVAGDHRGFSLVVEHIEIETASALSPSLLANRLYLKLGGQGLLTTNAVEPERVASNFAQDVAQQAIAAATPAWLVIDGVDTPGIPIAVLRFVDELVRWVEESPEIARGLRVILLGASLAGVQMQHLPQPANRALLPDVDLNVIREWFEAAVPGKPPILYSLTAESVFRDLPPRTGPDGVNRMRFLRLFVEAAHRKLMTV